MERMGLKVGLVKSKGDATIGRMGYRE